jgi:hypothetical protein
MCMCNSSDIAQLRPATQVGQLAIYRHVPSESQYVLDPQLIVGGNWAPIGLDHSRRLEKRVNFSLNKQFVCRYSRLGPTF